MRRGPETGEEASFHATSVDLINERSSGRKNLPRGQRKGKKKRAPPLEEETSTSKGGIEMRKRGEDMWCRRRIGNEEPAFESVLRLNLLNLTPRTTERKVAGVEGTRRRDQREKAEEVKGLHASLRCGRKYGKGKIIARAWTDRKEK